MWGGWSVGGRRACAGPALACCLPPRVLHLPLELWCVALVRLPRRSTGSRLPATPAQERLAAALELLGEKAELREEAMTDMDEMRVSRDGGAAGLCVGRSGGVVCWLGSWRRSAGWMGGRHG